MDHVTDASTCAPVYLFLLEMLNYLQDVGMKFITGHFILNCIQDIGFLINLYLHHQMYCIGKCFSHTCFWLTGWRSSFANILSWSGWHHWGGMTTFAPRIWSVNVKQMQLFRTGFFFFSCLVCCEVKCQNSMVLLELCTGNKIFFWQY